MTTSITNRALRISVLSNGSLTIEASDAGVAWESPVAGWISFFKDDSIVRIPLGSPESIEIRDGAIWSTFAQSSLNYTLITRIAPEGEGFAIEVVDLRSDLPISSVEYPAHLCVIPSGTVDSHLVVPFRQGIILPSRLDAGFMRFMHNRWRAISDIDLTLPFECGRLNMPWFGASTGECHLYFGVETASDCELHIIGNAVVGEAGETVDARHGEKSGIRMSSLTPVWLSSHRQLGYPRKLRVQLVDDGYVGMAKQYLRESKQSGRYVSLKEKIAANPLVERIIGAPDIKIYIYTNRPNTPYYRAWSEPILDGYTSVHTTFEQVGQMASEMEEMGIDRALVLLGGWNRAGYDREHVDMWPPAEGAGGADGLSRASEIVTQSGFLFSLHDNYQDYYVDAPSYEDMYIQKNHDGSLRSGGIWDGGHCRLICSAVAQELADRTVDAVSEETATNSYYLDTTSAASLYECFDLLHPTTRTEDKENKQALLRSLSRRGLVIGGEGGTDWAIGECSFFEGLPGGSVGYNGGVESVAFGIAVPLFDLVYHDAVVCYWQHGQPYGREDHINHVLHDILSAQPSSWSLVYDQWEDLKPLILQCYAVLSPLHRRTAHVQMTSHEFLSTDLSVQKSTFGDGTTSVVNFGITSYAVNGSVVPPKGFIITYSDGTIVSGRMSRDIVMER